MCDTNCFGVGGVDAGNPAKCPNSCPTCLPIVSTSESNRMCGIDTEWQYVGPVNNYGGGCRCVGVWGGIDLTHNSTCKGALTPKKVKAYNIAGQLYQVKEVEISCDSCDEWYW
jgi:hypothetical protein